MNNKDKFIRWQSISLNQLSFVNNLVLGLSVGLLAYLFNFIQPTEIELNCVQKFLFWISSLLSVTSIFVALILAINRLKDFRLTAKIARKSEKNSTDNIDNDRTESKELGKKTWKLFKWQIITFLISFLTSSILIIIELIDKLT